MKRFPAAVAMFLLAGSPIIYAAPNHRLAHGEQVFNTVGCRQCHTIGSTGGTRGPNLSAIGKRLNRSALRKQIVYGGRSMPPFGTILEKTDLDDLIAYLESQRGS